MLSESLRLLRVFHDLKQFELAEKLDLSKSYISEVENGNRTPSLEVIQKYADFFRVPSSSILFFGEQMDSSSKKEEIARKGISSKILNFLKMIENRTEVQVE